MNSNKRDIYFNGEIIVDFTGFNPNKNTVSKNKSYPVQGSHSFKDGEDVTGRYELQYQYLIGETWIPVVPMMYDAMNEPKRIVALPTTSPVAEQEKEAEGKECEHGYRGNCCCNCKNQIKLMCHPWNKGFGKGSISEQCGWVCTMQFSDGSNKGEGVFHDNEHGMCEMHSKK